MVKPNLERQNKIIADVLSNKNISKTKTSIIVRSGESMASIGGIICGWNDPNLTVTGKQQANHLLPAFYSKIQHFNAGIHSSDLIRCYKFADISVGFNAKKYVTVDQRLREINFGDVSLYNSSYKIRMKANTMME